MPRRQSTRIAAAALAVLLLAAAGPQLAVAITGTDSGETGTGGHEPAATHPPPNSPTAPMSVTPTGAPGSGDSSAPTIGGDAPKVVGFRSKADDLTPDDGNGHPDAFVNDNGVLTRVSTDPPGATVTDVVAGPSLSSTGDVVTYGAKLLEGESDVPVSRVVVVNRRTGATELAPPPRTGGDIGDVAVSPDGSVVTWEQGGNVYAHQIGSGTPDPVLVTRDQNGDPAGASSHPRLCAQGQRMVFASDSPMLVAGDTNGTSDILVVTGLLTPDQADDQVTRISRAHDGREADGDSTDPAITPDCNKVVFTSWATNVVPDDTNVTADVFVHDLTTATTISVSRGDGPSGQGSISGDGGYVAFASAADDLVPDDHNGVDPRHATPTSFQAVDRSGRRTFAASVLSVDGPRVRVAFPAPLDLATVSAGSVDVGALIDDQILSVDNGDGRSNTNTLATRGPTGFDPQGKPIAPSDDITDGPDLASAQVASDDAGTPDNTSDDVSVVSYCFDETVTVVLVAEASAGTENVTSDRFLLEGYNSSVRLRSTKATVERVAHEGGDILGACVRAWFAPGVDVARFTGAAVLDGAVADADGHISVKASRALGGTSFAPKDGDVTGPNLRSATADVTANRVTYVFDDLAVTDALLSTLATRFGFVDSDGALHRARYVTAADQKAHSVTVDFDVTTASVTKARRFVVLPGAVTNAGGEANVEQSTDGDVTGPELIAVTRVGALGAPGPPRFDFTFNADVTDADVAKFILYTEDGTGFPAGALERPNQRVVRISVPAVERFAESMILGVAQPGAVYERLVASPGPSVPAAAAPQATGETVGAPNPLGVKGITRRFSVPGSVTDGPDLVGVEIVPAVHAVDFVFDEAVRDVHLVLGRTPPPLPTDVFARELSTGDLLRASVDSDDRELPGSSFDPRISRDGRYVAYVYAGGIFLRDLLRIDISPRAIDFGQLASSSRRSDPKPVVIINRGFGPLVIRRVALAGEDHREFQLSSDHCTARTLYRNQRCGLSVAFAPTSSGLRVGDVSVVDNALGAPHRVALRGRGPVAEPPARPHSPPPTVTVSPDLGRPGSVVMVEGHGFPSGRAITLHWAAAAGATGAAAPFNPVVTTSTGTDGSFGPTPLLVLPGDVLGPRLAQAQGDEPGVVATAAFLVVPGTVQPEVTPTRPRTGFGELLRMLVGRLYLVDRR